MSGIHVLPAHADLIVWRYMDFLKFTDLLQRGALWFSRLDSFEDKHEGVLPASVAERLAALALGNPAYDAFKYENWRTRACVNCWHASDYESAAMWELYSTRAGLAIRSRVGLIRAAIPKDFDPGPWGLYGHTVEYVDLESYNNRLTSLSSGKPVVTASTLHLKRKSFEHEREYRLTVALSDSDKGEHGKYVPVSLQTMLEQIRFLDWGL